MNYANVIEFVKEKIAVNGRPPNYPFRDRFEHTMRVYRWAIKLQAKVGGDLDIIALAALLHDVGWEEGREHLGLGRAVLEFFEVYLCVSQILDGVHSAGDPYHEGIAMHVNISHNSSPVLIF